MMAMKKVWKVLLWAALGILALVVLVLALLLIAFPPEYVYRYVFLNHADVFDYRHLPAHTLAHQPPALNFAADDRTAEIDAAFEILLDIEDWPAYLAENQTTAFIVIRDDRILYEAYFNGFEADSIYTSYSVAKSFDSALVGIAIGEGAIQSVMDPITDYLPELLDRDPRFGEITLQDLLRMSSGIKYDDADWPWGDAALTNYYSDLRYLALNRTWIAADPGGDWLYNNYHPLLVGLILERSTGMPVTEYMAEKLWGPLGMAYDGTYSVDSLQTNFAKMESGVNARAMDYARFGWLFLNQGQREDESIIPRDWVLESTAPSPDVTESGYYPEMWPYDFMYYQYFWWGYQHPDGQYDFAAQGNLGQYIYVVPSKNMVIVRMGMDYGDPALFGWPKLFYDYAESLND
jgi:CubicO group peptidase (beta-lactamase class C family)